MAFGDIFGTTVTYERNPDGSSTSAEYPGLVARMFGAPTATVTKNPAASAESQAPKPASNAAESTAVVSSTAARDETANNQQELGGINTQLESVRQRALEIQEQLKLIDANQNGKTDTAAGTKTEDGGNEGGSDIQSEIDQINAALDAEYQSSVNLLDSALSTADNNTASLISSIQGMFSARIKQQQEINKRYERGVKTAGIVSGSSRYTPELQSGMIAAAEREGLNKIADLQAQEMQLIAQANQANEENRFKLLSERMSVLRDKRKEKQSAIADLYQRVLDEEKLRMDRAKFNMDMQQKGLDFQVDLAEQYAPSLASEISALPPEEQTDYIVETALGLGVDPATLVTALDTFVKDDFKYNLDIANIQSQIQSREYGDYIAGQRLALSQAEAGGYGTADNPYGWSTEQLRKLRSFGADPADIESSSQVIYGDSNAKAFTESQLESVGDALLEKIGSQKALDQLATGTIVSDGKTLRLTPGQIEYIEDWIMSSDFSDGDQWGFWR